MDVGIAHPLNDTYLTKQSTEERAFAANKYRNASRLRDWALRGRGRRTGGVFDLESTLGRRLGVKRDLELTLKSVKNLRCAESST